MGVRVIAQLAPAASVAGHVLVSVNSGLAEMLVSVTLVPEVFDSVTVWLLGRPTRVPLANVTLAGVAMSAGLTVRFALTAEELAEAVTATVVTLVTAPAVTANDWPLMPAGTTTDSGTGMAPGSLLARLTGRPPAGAFALSTTEPVLVWP